MNSRYSIKDLEQLSGIKAHTLRAWEQRHKLISPKRTSTNIRYYSDDDLRVVLNTAVLINHGEKIGRIAQMSADEIGLKALEVQPYAGDFAQELNELKISTLEFDVHRFERVMNRCVEAYGVHTTFRVIIGDYIKELGKLWLAGCVSISQEHFTSALIRQKLFGALDALPTCADSSLPGYVLFLPSNELHELGLLYLAYVLKERGECVYYLGQSMPKEYLKDLLAHRKVGHIISMFTTSPDSEELPQYLEELVTLSPGSDIVFHVCGHQINQLEVVPEFENLRIYGDLRELAESL